MVKGIGMPLAAPATVRDFVVGAVSPADMPGETGQTGGLANNDVGMCPWPRAQWLHPVPSRTRS